MGNADKKEPSTKALQFTQKIFEILTLASQDEDAHAAETVLQLLPLLETFNSMTEKSTKSEELTPFLYGIEQIAYQWQNTYCIVANNHGREAMRALLEALEEIYCNLMSLDPVLWIPPGTDGQTITEMQNLWQSIIKGKGNIRIVSKDSSFISCIWFSIAKLLQIPHGRFILSELNKLQNGPGRKIYIGENWRKTFKNKFGVKEWKPGSWVCPYAKLAKLNVDTYSIQEDGPGTGTGSYIQIDLTPVPFFVGLQREPLYEPCFITLGHELGHAYHNLIGVAYDKHQKYTHFPEGYPAEPIQQAFWSEPEEFQNITKNENALRVQHKLPQRMYHVGYDGLHFPEATQKFHTLMGQAEDQLKDLKDKAAGKDFQERMQELAVTCLSLPPASEDTSANAECLVQLKELNDAMESLLQELQNALDDQSDEGDQPDEDE